jgi:tRNA(adenine34) deaminase
MYMALSHEAIDKEMMARCIALSRGAVRKGEYPFAGIIVRDGEIIAEAVNRRFRECDVSRHAEIIALAQAQKRLGRNELRRCTLYSNIEPCAMCAFCIREAWIGRVVFALASPIMGGMSKWNILCDDAMSGRMPQVFGPVPQIVSGVLAHEAELAWLEWNPLAWYLIKRRGLLSGASADGADVQVQRGHPNSFWHHLQLALDRIGSGRAKGASLAVPNKLSRLAGD